MDPMTTTQNDEAAMTTTSWYPYATEAEADAAEAAMDATYADAWQDGLADQAAQADAIEAHYARTRA